MQATLEDYRVELDYYSGPLDLLLFLVRKNEIDLHDIPIAQLTEQYLQHLEEIKTIDVNLASEFLVMAATLLEIKSQMLAPKLETSEGEGDEAAKTGDALAGFGGSGDGEAGGGTGGGGMNPLDPRYELVQQLLAYKRLKDCAMELDERREEWDARFPHKPAKLVRGTPAWMSDGGGDGDDFTAESQGEAPEFDLEDVSINDLVEAFSRILEFIGQTPAMHAVTYDDTPISVHADDLVDRLTREGPLTLQSVFVHKRTRSEMIGLFLATLELVKLKKVRVMQDRIVGEIKLELRPVEEQLRAADDKPTDWKDPVTGEMQYEWPSEAARERAEKRATRRFNRMGKGLKADDEHDPADPVPFIVINKDSLEEMLESHAPKPAGEAEAQATAGSIDATDPASTRMAALAPLTVSATAEILREVPEDVAPVERDAPLTACAAHAEDNAPLTACAAHAEDNAPLTACTAHAEDDAPLTACTAPVEAAAEAGEVGDSVSASRFEAGEEIEQPRLVPWRRGEHRPVTMIPLVAEVACESACDSTASDARDKGLGETIQPDAAPLTACTAQVEDTAPLTACTAPAEDADPLTACAAPTAADLAAPPPDSPAPT